MKPYENLREGLRFLMKRVLREGG